MGCCQYKNLSTNYAETGELPATDAIYPISEKNLSNIQPNDVGFNNKESSNLTLKLKQINFDIQEQKKISEDSNYFSNKDQNPLFIPLNMIQNEKGL